jgi:hypothetical protein
VILENFDGWIDAIYQANTSRNPRFDADLMYLMCTHRPDEVRPGGTNLVNISAPRVVAQLSKLCGLNRHGFASPSQGSQHTAFLKIDRRKLIIEPVSSFRTV